MTGKIFLQRSNNGSKLENPIGVNGNITIKDRKLFAFDDCRHCISDMLVTDLSISANGIMIEGVEDATINRKSFQQLWFVPR